MKKIFFAGLFLLLTQRDYCQTAIRSDIKSTIEKDKTGINLNDFAKLINECNESAIHIEPINIDNTLPKKNGKSCKEDSNMNTLSFALPFNGGIISMPIENQEKFFKGISIPYW